MTCTLSIQAKLLEEPLEYKYVIFSPKMIGTDDCYEFLHSFGYRDLNRCLHIDKTKHYQAIGGNSIALASPGSCSLNFSIVRGIPSVRHGCLSKGYKGFL